MFFQFFDQKQMGWRGPLIIMIGLGMALAALSLVLIVLRALFSVSLFFGVFFLFFCLPALIKLFFVSFFKFLSRFLLKKATSEQKCYKDSAVGDVVDVSYEVVS
ncbi:MAG: hypothetical protein ABIC68_06250 [Candidatus Omnitrophota bacterium]